MEEAEHAVEKAAGKWWKKPERRKKTLNHPKRLRQRRQRRQRQRQGSWRQIRRLRRRQRRLRQR